LHRNRDDREVYENITVGLRGPSFRRQCVDTLALAEALRERGFAISGQSIIDGIESAQHPGRLEMWPGQPRILFDGAHNPAAAAALGAYLDEFVRNRSQ